MRRMLKVTMVAVLGLGSLFAANPARADTVKEGIFVLGIHLGGAHWIAGEFRNDPTSVHPGAMELMNRQLNWSIALAKQLKASTASLEKFQREYRGMTFPAMEAELFRIIQEQQMWAARTFEAKAGHLFVLGVHESQAEAIALARVAFPRDQKPGSGGIIARNVKWLEDNVKGNGLGLTTDLVMEIQRDVAGTASFAVIQKKLETLRLRWQTELRGQPGFGAVAGTVIFSTTGQLTKSDPTTVIRKQPNHHYKVFQVNLQAGQTYVIDLVSNNGPGSFDNWLQLTSASGQVLAEDDDSGDGLNARIRFSPTHSGTYRIVVTTYTAGAVGNFTLTVKQ